MLPPATTVPGPDFTSDRSAEAVTPVVTDELLFSRLGSAVVAETAARLVSEAACAGAVTRTVIVGAVAPVASDARVHVTDTFPALEMDRSAEGVTVVVAEAVLFAPFGSGVTAAIVALLVSEPP